MMAAYMDIFNENELPMPMTMLEAIATVHNLSAVAKAKFVYDTLMEEVCGGSKPYLQPRRLEEEHLRAKNKALHAFHSKPKMGGEERASGYEADLIMELEENFVEFRAHNLGKSWFVRAGPLLLLLGAALVYYLDHTQS